MTEPIPSQVYLAPVGTQPGDPGWVPLGTWSGSWTPTPTDDGDNWLLSTGTVTQATMTLTTRLDRRTMRVLLGIPVGERWQPRRRTRAQRRRGRA